MVFGIWFIVIVIMVCNCSICNIVVFFFREIFFDDRIILCYNNIFGIFILFDFFLKYMIIYVL